jgi:hypothetical protein
MDPMVVDALRSIVVTRRYHHPYWLNAATGVLCFQIRFRARVLLHRVYLFWESAISGPLFE